MSNFIYIVNKRIDLRNNNRLIIQTVSGKEIMANVKSVCFVNGQEYPMQIVRNERAVLKFSYRKSSADFDGEFNLLIDLPEKVNDIRVEFEKTSYPAGHHTVKLSASEIKKLKSVTDYRIETVAVDNGELHVIGWAVTASPVNITAESEGKPVEGKTTHIRRADIARGFLEGELCEEAGFDYSVPVGILGKRISLKFDFDGKCVTRTIDIDKTKNLMLAGQSSYFARAKAYIAFYGLGAFISKFNNKVNRYVSTYGYKQLFKKAGNVLFNKGAANYDRYFKNHFPDEETLKQQREYVFEKTCKLSILIPVYRPSEKFFTLMLDSVVNQTYSNWQICLADGGGEGHTVEKLVKPYIAKYGEDKVKYTVLTDNLGIAENTNAAMALADGDYIVFGDHDDELHPSAFFEVMRAIEKNEPDMIYTDEDKIIGASGKHTGPHFKPDFNLELLRSNNYICHLCVAKRTLIENVGKLKREYDGAQDYDYILRLSEKAENIVHIPMVLYHWRISEYSTAMAQGVKNYANEAGKRALSDHLERCGIKATVSGAHAPCIYSVDYELTGTPLVSILIPNKDHIDDLKKCINSVNNSSSYQNVEYVIIENNSTDEATFAYYEELKKDPSFVFTSSQNAKLAGESKINVVYYKGDFNYSAINNYGAKFARGEVFLLLNNDIELIEPDAVRSMLSYAQRLDVGAVGARLLYADNTVQHAGVILGFHGVAGHAFCGLPDSDNGYCSRSKLPQDLSAVTAACLMTRRAVYEEVGGLDETLKVAFNDIDFCMAIRKAGYRVVYDSKAKLYHYESKSRGLEDTPERMARFESEVLKFSQKWEKELDAGDPYYNVNLSLDEKSYTLKDY